MKRLFLFVLILILTNITAIVWALNSRPAFPAEWGAIHGAHIPAERPSN
jgi:hypothetical protein